MIHAYSLKQILYNRASSFSEITLTRFYSPSLVAQLVKNPRDAGNPGLISGSGRFPGEGNGNPFQDSCLGNPMDRGAWQAAVPMGSQGLVTT